MQQISGLRRDGARYESLRTVNWVMKLSLAAMSSRSFRSIVPLHMRSVLWACVFIVGIFSTGCSSLGGALGLGKYRGIERTASDEAFYLVKEIHLSSGSIQTPKENFDHATNETVNLVFIPKNERPVYVTKSVWYDPNDQEFRTIRATYDRSEETKKAI